MLNPESYPLAGGIQPVLDLAASALLPGYAFAQVSDSTPPTFVSSELDLDAGVLTITFSETIDAANVVPAKMHIRESGNYTHGITLSAGELGTTVGGATISFTLTPSHLAAVAGLATPELTIEPGAVRDESGNLIAGTFDASTRSFVDATGIGGQDGFPASIAFSNDGTKMFIVGGAEDAVNEYDLSSPFDASTRSFVDATGIGGREDSPRGIAFSNDGTKMFIVGNAGDDVNEYDLSSPFDASTRSFVDATGIGGPNANPQDIAFSNNGTKMFILGDSGDDVNEYDLSSPFDASTLSFVDATGIGGQDTDPRGIAFSNDGTKMFMLGGAEDAVNEYDLSSPFDASTRSFVDATGIGEQDANPQDIAFSNDGAKMFMLGAAGDAVNEYALSSVYPVTVTRMHPTFDSSKLDLDAGVLTITFSETIDAANVVPAKMHIRESGNYTHGITLSAGELVTVADGATISFTLTPSHLAAVAGLATPKLTIEPGAVRDEHGNPIVGTFDASARKFVDATSILAQVNDPRDIAFSSDGTRMFVIGSSGGGVNEYELSAPFDASTRMFVDATSISEQETFPTGIAFSSDGTRMFVVGDTEDNVNEYELSAPFDASTMSFVDATSIRAQDFFPTGIAFSSDGTRMFVVGSTGDDVNEYELSAPFDASTMSFVDATSISEQEDVPTGIAFSNDGTRMFVIGFSGDDVNEYELSAPFDASTRRFIDATSISEQESFPTGIAFSNDGTRMFVIGFGEGNVNEYALGSVYPVTVTRTPPTFVSSVLDAGVLTITFSETIDAANIVPAKMHIRESGNYTHGITLSAGELDTVADGATISFTLTTSHNATVAGLTEPELTIEPGAVRDESGNPIVGTFDASTRTFVDATSISAQETAPTGIAFSSDGTRMFVVGFFGDDVNEYDLSTPFDASTRSFVDATSISEQETAPTGIAFSSDGTRMFVIGDVGADVNEYELSSPFDASTRMFVDATSISEQEDAPTGIAFSSDGARMFVIDGGTGENVNEYDAVRPVRCIHQNVR